MFDQLKYIVTIVDGCTVPIIFSPILEHLQMSRGKVLGAGAVQLFPKGDTIGAHCFGKSVSLDVVSRGVDDALVIEKEINRED